MAKIFDVVQGINTVLDSAGLNTHNEPVGSVDSPAAVTTLGASDTESSMSGDSRDRQFVVDLFLTNGPQGMENLYDYLDDEGDKSLILLFNQSQTLDGLVDYAVLSNWNKPDRITMEDGGQFYHVEVFIDVGMS